MVDAACPPQLDRQFFFIGWHSIYMISLGQANMMDGKFLVTALHAVSVSIKRTVQFQHKTELFRNRFFGKSEKKNCREKCYEILNLYCTKKSYKLLPTNYTVCMPKNFQSTPIQVTEVRNTSLYCELLMLYIVFGDINVTDELHHKTGPTSQDA
jgi:hypothetical protein